MNKFNITISLFLVVLICQTAIAQKHTKDEDSLNSFKKLRGTYFNENYYIEIAAAKNELVDIRISGYLDTLMTWGVANSPKPNMFFKGTYSLSEDFRVSIVGVEHKWESKTVESNSIWAVIFNSEGHVIDSECLFNQGKNRIYSESICSVLGSQGKMVIQRTPNSNLSEVKYIDWGSLYEDGTPSVYFHCFNDDWTKGYGGLMGDISRLTIQMTDYWDSFDRINLMRIEYLRTDYICKRIASGIVKPANKFLIQSLQSKDGNSYVVILESIQVEDNSEKYLLKVYESDIYHLDLENHMDVCNLIEGEDLRNMKISFQSRSSGIEFSGRIAGRIAFRPYFKMLLK